ncbi:MAG: outer membrane protein assembly factor BamD [Holosporales bacterium]|jgi:outer membrane protein assembly factor BamD|nr:outer membrane protein assembly factor BamD [Holosporales bacterium]
MFHSTNKFFVILCCLLLSACSKRIADPENDSANEKVKVEKLYETAAKNMYSKSFKKAARGFEKVCENFPYSKWAMQARLMGAYCKYQAHLYEDAIDEFTIFAKLHPFHKDTPYAYYMIGLAHYERISIVERDQEDSAKAIEAFQTVIERFPASNYAKDAKFKIDFIKNHLAAKEMQVGRFYQKEKSYLAAINRFKNVVTTYQTTEQTPEALLRLMECYAALNIKEEFLSIFSILKLNHPKSSWYKQAEGIHEEFIKLSLKPISSSQKEKKAQN